MSLMPPAPRCFAPLILLALPALTYAQAQKTPAAQLIDARATYYTPTTAGLRSLHCDIGFDWKAFLTEAGGKPVADDNPAVTYLKTVHLAVDDSLQGQGTLAWHETAPANDMRANVDQLHTAFAQILSGFFQSWNQFMNGSMVPAPDATTTVTRAGEGLHLAGTTSSTKVDEDFDKNMLLTNAHVVLPTADVILHPTYTDTPDGRIISAIDSEYRQPPTAPPVHLIMGIEYQQVSGFRIPATLHINLVNSGKFSFTFDNCSVGKAGSQ
jgi:hypothetical protein